MTKSLLVVFFLFLFSPSVFAVDLLCKLNSGGVEYSPDDACNAFKAANDSSTSLYTFNSFNDYGFQSGGNASMGIFECNYSLSNPSDPTAPTESYAKSLICEEQIQTAECDLPTSPISFSIASCSAIDTLNWSSNSLFRKCQNDNTIGFNFEATDIELLSGTLRVTYETVGDMIDRPLVFQTLTAEKASAQAACDDVPEPEPEPELTYEPDPSIDNSDIGGIGEFGTIYPDGNCKDENGHVYATPAQACQATVDRINVQRTATQSRHVSLNWVAYEANKAQDFGPLSLVCDIGSTSPFNVTNTNTGEVQTLDHGHHVETLQCSTNKCYANGGICDNSNPDPDPDPDGISESEIVNAIDSLAASQSSDAVLNVPSSTGNYVSSLAQLDIDLLAAKTELTDVIDGIKTEVGSIFSLSLSSGGSINSIEEEIRGVTVEFNPLYKYPELVAILASVIMLMAAFISVQIILE